MPQNLEAGVSSGVPFRLWTSDSFAANFYSVEVANKLFREMKILPCFLFGSLFSPKDQPIFYRNLAGYLLAPTDETKEMMMFAKIKVRDGRTYRVCVRAWNMVLNEGQYACFALSFLPLPIL